MRLFIDLAGLVGFLVYMAWTFSAVCILSSRELHREPKEIFQTIFWEMRPFYWPSVVALWMLGIVPDPVAWAADWINWAYIPAFYLTWRWLKDVDDDDDDRWKRRRRRAAEAVKSIGSRLVVVPAPAGAS